MKLFEDFSNQDGYILAITGDAMDGFIFNIIEMVHYDEIIRRIDEYMVLPKSRERDRMIHGLHTFCNDNDIIGDEIYLPEGSVIDYPYDNYNIQKIIHIGYIF